MPKIIYHDSDGVDKAIVLSSEPIMIGRATECQIQTQDAMVSRRHARIFWDGSYIIEDLGSSNGVYVGNEKVTRAPIRPGDTVTCGSLVLKLMPDTSPRTSERALNQMTGAMPPTAAPPPPAAPPPARAAAPPMAPPPMAAPPMAPPPMAAPPMQVQTAAVPSVQVGPNAVLRGAVAEATAATGLQNSGLIVDLQTEKRRRADAENALLQAEERVKAAEERARVAEERARAAESRAAEGGGGGDARILQRKVDQLTADLRRMRGGKDPEEPAPSKGDDGDRAARLAAESERDRLRQRVADLEAEVANAGGAPSAAAGADPAEALKLRRQVDQLTAELRRVRSGQPDASGDAARLGELTAELRRAEAERDAFKAQALRAPSASKIDPAASDAAIALSDALAEVRASLRAANDEAGLLTAPAESVTVVGDSLRSASEQLEAAREQLRKLAKLLGVA
jgi:FHA domain